MTLPKQKIVKPRSIRDYDNGQIPKELLFECGLGERLLLVEPAARAFRALVKFYGTHEDGIEISATSCYRSRNEQVRLFRESFTETKVTGQIMKRFNGKNYYLKKNVAQVKVPGKSSHGWGLAIDIALFKKGTKTPITSQVIKLLCGNAVDFGFCAELDSKPWHWVYFAGDEIPPAVLKTENDVMRFLTYQEFQNLHGARECIKRSIKDQYASL